MVTRANCDNYDLANAVRVNAEPYLPKRDFPPEPPGFVALQSNVTFKRIALDIVNEHRERGALRTAATTLSTINHLIKTFKTDFVQEMLPDDFYLRHVPRARRETPKRNLNNDRKIFIQIMYRAYRRGLVRVPPIKIPKPSIDKDIGRELSDEEIGQLFTNCNCEEFRFQMELALKTGMRLREMLRLKWVYVSNVRSSITLPPEVTKTKRGREFAVNTDVMRRLIARYPNGSEFVFPSRNDKAKAKFDLKYEWECLKQKARIEARWHDLRHTSATKKLRARIPIEIVAKEMGMSEVVLKRVYNHINLDDMRAAADAVNIDWTKK